MTEELIEFVNRSSKDHGIANKIFGMKKIENTNFYLIHCEDKDHFWLPQHLLCQFHDKMISKWMNLYGDKT